jgi:amidase
MTAIPPPPPLLQHDASTLSGLLERREVSAVELMEETLRRIDHVNPVVNGIVSLRNEKDLLEAAKAADADLNEGRRKGWLHGIPIAIKDLSDTLGILSTKGGSPMHSDRIPDADDLFVGRLKEAGAIVIGKTNAPELGLGSHTFNRQFGRTLNPYDQSRTPGGSSGGAAVAIATKMLCIADGSDMMGSLRNPAGWNNIYSLRPTAGLVDENTATNAVLPYPISTCGPMARTPRDLSLLLETLAGDKYQHKAAIYDDTSERDLSGYRIGWLGNWCGAYPMEEGICEQCEEALSILRLSGVELVRVAAPFPAAKLWTSWTTLRSKVISDNMIDEFGEDFFEDKEVPFKKELVWEVSRGVKVSEDQIEGAVKIASDWSHRVGELFEEYDALALPSAQMWPFPACIDWPKAIGNSKMDTYHRWMAVVVPATLAGLPVGTVPAGFGSNGLPIGLQLMCNRGNDSLVLELCTGYHSRADWPNKRPPEIQSIK